MYGTRDTTYLQKPQWVVLGITYLSCGKVDSCEIKS